jgi:arginase family enzyme
MTANPQHYGPPDASAAPRYTGIRTFARLPQVQLPAEGIDAAVLGVPFDTATSFRPGARFGDGPVYMSFDIDVLDPAFAPGTGTPEVAGLQPREALDLLRALAGIRFTGFDLVEVSPVFDGPGQVTALHAAAVAYEMLALLAVSRR